MERPRFAKDVGAEMTGEIERRPQIDSPPDKRGQLEDHSPEADHARGPTFLELDQHINIAVGAKVIAQHASEE